MEIIDTHTHLYLNPFEKDRKQVIERALEASVKAMILPNIDSTSFEPMMHLYREYPTLTYPTIGLHPSSVKDNYKDELLLIEKWLSEHKNFVAIGEIGMDLYWDKTFLEEQKNCLQKTHRIRNKLPSSADCSYQKCI
jgi:TatD DNase family protein